MAETMTKGLFGAPCRMDCREAPVERCVSVSSMRRTTVPPNFLA
jgi:hypothetical protein